MIREEIIVPQYDTRTTSNQAGGYYSYGDDEDESYDTSIVRQSQYNPEKQQTKYQNWGNKNRFPIGVTLLEHKPYIPTMTFGGWGYPYGWGGWRSPFYRSYYGGGLGLVGVHLMAGAIPAGELEHPSFGWGGVTTQAGGMGGFYDPVLGQLSLCIQTSLLWEGYYRPWAGGGYYAP